MLRHRTHRPGLFVLVSAASALALGGCTSASWLTGSGSGKLEHQSVTLASAAIESDAGSSSGAFVAGARFTQTLAADPDSPIAGAKMVFPPGALAIDTQITMRVGSDVSKELAGETALTQSLALSPDKVPTSVGHSVEIVSSADTNTLKPFTLALPMPGEGLRLAGGGFLIVIYRANDVDNNALIVGLIPTSDIRVENGQALFDTRTFGTYQLAVSPVDIGARREVRVGSLVASAPIEIEQAMPYAAGANAEVVVMGRNFTPKMTLALGPTRIERVRVLSDVKASFVMPPEAAYGFTTAAADQGDDHAEFKLFARAEKTDYPLITMEAAGVCKGVKYYDAAGNLLEGTRDCNGGSGTDANGNGRPDRADSADTAARAVSAGTADTAGRADFSSGKVGTPIAAAALMKYPGDGDFFTVTGSTVITGLTRAPAGTRVTLYFDSNPTILSRRYGTNAIWLTDTSSGQMRAGMVLGLIATENGWRETTRNWPDDYILAARVPASGIALPSGGETPVQLDLVDQAGDFVVSATTGEVTFKRTMWVNVWGNGAIETAAPWGYCSMRIYRNGEALPSNASSNSVSNGYCYAYANAPYSDTSGSGMLVNSGDTLQFKVSFSSETGAPGKLVRITGAEFSSQTVFKIVERPAPK
jgi:hypothetical protein